MDDYGKVRVAHCDGMSIRAIARAFKHSRRNGREILASSLRTPYTRARFFAAAPLPRRDPPPPRRSFFSSWREAAILGSGLAIRKLV